MEQQDFYRFLQMRNRLQTIMKDTDLSNLENGNMKMFVSAYKGVSNNKIISRIYNCFSNKKSEEAFYIKEKWDRESNRVLSKEEWHMACQAQWKTTSSLIWREFSWKTLVRFFITPLQKRHRTGSSLCWRRCQCTEAGHHHVFWSCPVLTDYWQNIHQTLEEVFRFTIPFRFDVLYLGNVPQSVRSTDRALMLTLLTASKKL